MGSGREGSPSAAKVEAASGRASGRRGGMSSPMRHRLEREELLEGGGGSGGGAGSSPMAMDLTNALPGATLRVSTTQLISPRKLHAATTTTTAPAPRLHTSSSRRNTPLHSPQSRSPLHSPRPEPASGEIVLFQEAFLHESSLQHSPTMPRHEDAPQPKEEGRAIASRRSRSEIAEGRHRSPYSSRRYKADAVQIEEETHVYTRSWKAEAIDTASEKVLPMSPGWGVGGERGKSPRRGKKGVDMVEMQEEEGAEQLPIERKMSKSSSRRARAEVHGAQEEGDLGMGDKNRAARHGHSRPHTRQSKRKAPDALPNLALALPQSYPATLQQPSPPLQSHSLEKPSRTSSRRSAIRETRHCVQGSDWLQFAVDIIMWRHIPRSSLLFGVGCFCILSASAIQDMQHSVITIMAYLALLYLAGIFFHHTFFRGADSQTAPLSFSYEICESDALKLIRLVLPAINALLNKFSKLFSGEPVVTLKVAVALWLLARAGYIMSFWTLVRLAYFALFIIPKCYSCYHSQLHRQAQSLLLWAWTAWDACLHKKPIVIAAVVLAWNFSSLSTRICGAFALIVAFRTYRQFLGIHQDDDHYMDMQHEGGRASGMNWAVSHGLELMTVPQPGFEHRT